MNICIHKNILGTGKHLFANKVENQYYWSDKIDNESWVFGDENKPLRCANSVLRALKLEVLSTPEEKYINSWHEVGKSCNGDVDWEKALHPDVFKEFVSRLVDQLWCVLEKIDDTYYGNEFLSCRSVTRSLTRACIDTKTFNALLKESKSLSGRKSLSSFAPDGTGKAQLPVYSTTSSVTGRLTVKSGPNILTMKKSLRKIIKSKHPGGKIVQVDFVSLEPRVLLLMQEKKAPEDIYSYIRTSVLGGKFSRSVAKSATLGAIFGISSTRFQENSSLSPDESSSVLREVRRFFNVSSVGKGLKREMLQNGYIENVYGRKVTPSTSQAHVLVNNKVQSTGVDVALLGFDTLLSSFKRLNIQADPLFLIHDAIILDVPETDINKVRDIVKQGIYNKRFDAIFPVSIEEV